MAAPLGGALLALLESCSSSPRKLQGVNLIRSQIKNAAPSHFIKIYSVNPDGKNGAYTTFAQAYGAITQDRQKRIGSGAPAQSNPWDWRAIHVAPGTYHECLVGLPPHTAIIGQGSRPEDVRIWWDGTNNTFESTGRSTYVHNLHLDHTSLNPDVHAMRDNGPAGDVDMGEKQRRTVVFDSVKFSSARGASLGKCTNDMAPRGGVSLIFHHCEFDGPGQPQAINLITGQGEAPGPSTIAFVDCLVTSNHEQHPSAEWKQLSEVDAAPVGIPDFSNGRGDRVLWVDGRWNVGKTHGVQGLIVMPYIKDSGQTKIVAKKPSTEYILLNPGSVSGVRTTLSEGTLAPTQTLPSTVQIPQNCYSAEEAKFYGARPTAPRDLMVPAEKSGSMSVRAGEIYWIAAPVQSQALCASRVEVSSLSAGTVAAAVVLDLQGKPYPDANAGTYANAVTTSSDSGVNLSARWFYPGQGHIWVGVSFTADATVASAKASSGGAYLASTGGGTQVPLPNSLTALPAGSAVPVVRIVGSLPHGMSADS